MGVTTSLEVGMTSRERLTLSVVSIRQAIEVAGGNDLRAWLPAIFVGQETLRESDRVARGVGVGEDNPKKQVNSSYVQVA